MIPTKKEAALAEAAPSKNIRGADNPIIADTVDHLESSVLGYAIHANTVEFLPHPRMFRPGAARHLAVILHGMNAAGKPVDHLSVRVELERICPPRPVWDAFANAASAGAAVVREQAVYYAKQLEWSAKVHAVTNRLRSVAQLLQGGPETVGDALVELGVATTILGGEAA